MRVLIDLGKCNGYGSCVIAAPTVFQLNESGDFADVIAASPPPERRAEVLDAVRVCPTRAISVVDDVGDS